MSLLMFTNTLINTNDNTSYYRMNNVHLFDE